VHYVRGIRWIFELERIESPGDEELRLGFDEENLGELPAGSEHHPKVGPKSILVPG
jgi:hypothetical protein